VTTAATPDRTVLQRADAVPSPDLGALVDVPEGDAGQRIDGVAHDITGDPGVNAWAVDTRTSMVGWHTATIEWAPVRPTFVSTTGHGRRPTRSSVPTDPMRWVLQMETR
jgi:hypothetical protein